MLKTSDTTVCNLKVWNTWHFFVLQFVLYFQKYFLYEQHQVQGREWFQTLGTVGPVKKRTGMRLNSDKN